LKKLINFTWRQLSKYVFPFIYKLNGNRVRLGKNVILFGFPIIKAETDSNIIIGNNVVLCSKSENTALGVSKPVILRAMKPEAVISIDERSGISGATICAMEHISIGKECLLGSDVMIFDNDFHSLNPAGRRFSQKDINVKPVVIENNVFIGARAIVMKGVKIGENSVIGAGSVVVSNIPSNVIAAGNPCKIIKSLGHYIEK